MKQIWGIMKRLVNINQMQSYQTNLPYEDGRIINDKFDISKYFNDLFTYVWLNLATRIPKAYIDLKFYNRSRDRNTV